MTKLWTSIVSGVAVLVLGAAATAGGRGLLIAQANETKLEILQEQMPRVEERMHAVETGLSNLKGAVDARAESESEFREEQRQVNRDLNTKLDALLARPR